MSIDSAVSFQTDGVPSPNNTAINATGPSTTDGTEFVKLMIDNYMFGTMQAMLDRTGQTPNGVTEAAGASQFLDGLDLMCNAPGIGTEWSLALDPGVTGHRCLFRNGQGVLIANYPELDAAVYVGDGNNVAVHAGGGAFYRASDAAGTTPNIAGPYLILDESRGVTTRGLDTAASIDPDGASRVLGDLQIDAMQRITGNTELGGASIVTPTGVFSVTAIGSQTIGSTGASTARQLDFDSADSTSPNAAKTDDVETRMYNRSTKFVIWY